MSSGGQPSAAARHLDLLDAQRTEILRDLADMDPTLLWLRPAPKKWSIGEHLEHSRVLMLCFRCLLGGAYSLAYPLAWLLRRRPHPTEIDNVYVRPGFPNQVGFFWPPRHNAERPISLAELGALLEGEHRRVRAFYEGKSGDILGQVWLYDPAIGWLNMIQALRVGVYHDAHHYERARKLRAGPGSEDSPGRDC